MSFKSFLVSALFRQTKRMSRKNLYEFLKESITRFPENSHVLNIGAGSAIGEAVDAVAGGGEA
jgi:hypothetical protein